MTQTRTTDPATSHANESESAASRAAGFVRALMADGIQRTDEDIADAMRGIGCGLSPQRLRGGRKALSDSGYLVCVGVRRTEYRRHTRIWCVAPEGQR